MTTDSDFEELKQAVRDFFGFLDIKEESDSGRVFSPIYISCCRVMKQEPLADCLGKMRDLSK